MDCLQIFEYKYFVKKFSTVNVCNGYVMYVMLIFRLKRGKNEKTLPPADLRFEVQVETDLRQAYRQLQKALQGYKDEKKGPTLIAIQSCIGQCTLSSELIFTKIISLKISIKCKQKN